jgi:hypothetical protein
VLELTGTAADARDIDAIGAVFDEDGSCVKGEDHLRGLDMHLPYEVQMHLIDNLHALMVRNGAVWL